MPTFSFQRSLALIALALVAVSGAIGTSPAQAAARSVTFAPSFSSDSHLGEGTTLTTAFTFAGTEYNGLVDPLTGLTIHLPAGIGLSDAGFPTCSKETIETAPDWHTACPAGSLAGPEGSLTAFLAYGGGPVEEHAGVQAVFGPAEALYFVLQDAQPLAQEYILMEGHVVSDSPPYGQALVLQVSLIETDPHLPDGSITALTLNLGTTREESDVTVPSVTVPATCPSGKFAWAADAAFNGEASEPVAATETVCPTSEHRHATTTTLQVSNTAPVLGETVTYTATVTPTSSNGSEPSGTVTFVDETVPIPGCTAQPLTPGISSSTATCQASYSAYGVHGISATYGGDTNYLGSASLTETVTLSSGTEEALRKRHEEEANPKAGGSTPSTGSSGSTGSGSGSSPTVTIGGAQIAALLGQQLIPSGKAAKIGALLKAGGLTMPFQALEAGTAVIGWYEVPAGAKLARHSSAKPVLVALGRVTFLAAGTGKIKVGLTAAGKRLLKHAKRLRLTAKGVFTPLGQAPVTADRGIALAPSL
jgi:hypothetical protein